VECDRIASGNHRPHCASLHCTLTASQTLATLPALMFLHMPLRADLADQSAVPVSALRVLKSLMGSGKFVEAFSVTLRVLAESMVSLRRRVAAQVAAAGAVMIVLTVLVLNNGGSPSPNELLQEVRSVMTAPHERVLHRHRRSALRAREMCVSAKSAGGWHVGAGRRLS
jgi:hypothetical protein